MTKARLIYVTTASKKEATDIASTLLSEKRIACANIYPEITSVFEWEGAIQTEVETVLILKTVQEQVDTITKRITQLHSYDCPCIVSLPIESGHEDFLQWIKQHCLSR